MFKLTTMVVYKEDIIYINTALRGTREGIHDIYSYWVHSCSMVSSFTSILYCHRLSPIVLYCTANVMIVW